MAVIPGELIIARLGEMSELTFAANLFEGGPVDMPGIPDECAFVLERGGSAIEPFIGEDKDWFPGVVQVWLRGNPRDRKATQELIRKMRTQVHRASLLGVTIVLVREPLPNHILTDKEHRDLFNFNVRVEYKE